MDQILKTRDIRINIDQNLTFESIFEKYETDKIKVRIVNQKIGTDEPMEVIIRQVQELQTFEGKTGPYIPPEEKKEEFKKKGIIKKIGEALIP